MPKVMIDDDSVDELVVAALKRCRRHAGYFKGPHAEDLKYYQELAAAIAVVLKHYTADQ